MQQLLLKGEFARFCCLIASLEQACFFDVFINFLFFNANFTFNPKFCNQSYGCLFFRSLLTSIIKSDFQQEVELRVEQTNAEQPLLLT